MSKMCFVDNVANSILQIDFFDRLLISFGFEFVIDTIGYSSYRNKPNLQRYNINN